MIRTLRKAISLLDRRQRIAWLRLIPLSVIVAVLEAIGAAAILALIRLLDEPDPGSSPGLAPALREAAARWGVSPIALAVAVIGCFYLVKNALGFLSVYARQRCSAEIEASIAKRLLERYLRAPYPFHLRRSSADLIRVTTSSASTVSRMVLLSATAAVSEMLVVSGILAVVVHSAPAPALIAGAIVSASMVGMLRITQSAHTRWGKQNQELLRSIWQVLQQGLGGVKELKILRRERFFSDVFARRWRELLSVQVWRGSLESVPRLVVETLFVFGVIGVVIGSNRAGGGELVPLLGLFAYAGFRVLPSLQAIVGYHNLIRFGAAAVDEVDRDWQSLSIAGRAEESIEPLPFREEISLSNVSYRYPDADRYALAEIDLAIARGESVGIVGTTGAGKTTLVDLILGLLTPTAGRIRVDGVDIRERLASWQSQIGYVPQSVYLIDDSIRRNIAFGIDDGAIDSERVDAALRMAQLERFLETLPDGLDTVVGERGVRLSGGQRQRIAVARALYHDPEVLVFDEATTGLDLATEQELTAEFQRHQRKKTLLFVSHRLNTLRHCDRLVFVQDGRIAGVGPFDALSARSAAFREFSTPAAAASQAESARDAGAAAYGK